MVGIQDLIRYASLGDDGLRGLVVARCRFYDFHIDLCRRPYNTVALLCECVISLHKFRLQTCGVGAEDDVTATSTIVLSPHRERVE